MGGIDTQFQRLITGTFTAVAQSADIASPNQTTSVIQFSGTWVGTVVLEGSNDNVTYYTIPAINSATLLSTTAITNNGLYLANTNGYSNLRLRTSAWTSGTATYNVYGSDAATIQSSLNNGQFNTTPPVLSNAQQGPLQTDKNANLKTVNIGQIVRKYFDYIDPTYPLTTQEVYTFKVGGSGGTTVAIVTVNYTDATKEVLGPVSVVEF